MCLLFFLLPESKAYEANRKFLVGGCGCVVCLCALCAHGTFVTPTVRLLRVLLRTLLYRASWQAAENSMLRSTDPAVFSASVGTALLAAQAEAVDPY